MATSELAEIRALLIAQTETPEPARAPGLLGLVGELLKARTASSAPLRPLDLSPALPRVVKYAPPKADDEPLFLGEEIYEDLFMPIEPPPPPRAEFGVRPPRPYLPHDSVLLLNRVIITPPQALNPSHASQTPHEVPYFPGDLDDAIEPAPPTVRIERRAAISPMRIPRAEPPPAWERPGLARDLLQALALTLTREHETLCDRLSGAGGPTEH